MRLNARCRNNYTANRLAIGHILHHSDDTLGRDFTAGFFTLSGFAQHASHLRHAQWA